MPLDDEIEEVLKSHEFSLVLFPLPKANLESKTTFQRPRNADAVSSGLARDAMPRRIDLSNFLSAVKFIRANVAFPRTMDIVPPPK